MKHEGNFIKDIIKLLKIVAKKILLKAVKEFKHTFCTWNKVEKIL
jgi:hypothetical protein